jgi:hypothetical protein
MNKVDSIGIIVLKTVHILIRAVEGPSYYACSGNRRKINRTIDMKAPANEYGVPISICSIYFFPFFPEHQ